MAGAAVRWSLLGALTLPLATACQLFRRGASAPDAGVPLTEFTARDGRYFPPFISKFFPGAGAYASSYPTIGQAREGVTLIEVRQLADGGKLNEANLSWSADGVYLGYEVMTDGFRKIMLKDLAGDFSRELQVLPRGRSDFLDGMVVKSAQSYNAGLRWSRDSTRFAFMSNGGVGDYAIYVGAVGAKEQQIAGNSGSKDGYATWSPATNEIAFVSSRRGNGDIYLVDLSSRALTRLSTSDAVNIFPEWFPGGDRLVFASGDALNHDLQVVERPARRQSWAKPAPLTLSARDNLRPTVSPDGRLVAFYSDDPTSPPDARRWDILAVPYEPGKTFGEMELRAMAVARDVVIDLNTGPAWSPDSRKLFFIKRDPAVFNPIYAYDLYSGRTYLFKTSTRMNRDILMSKLGVLSFRAQVGVWDRVFVALTNQGLQLQTGEPLRTKIHYLPM